MDCVRPLTVRKAFDAGKSITRASVRGLVPGNLDLLGKWHRAARRIPFGAEASEVNLNHETY
jgi:hypothetical protein